MRGGGPTADRRAKRRSGLFVFFPTAAGGFNCHGVDSRHLRPQVFLTVNVVGHVTWLGKEQVRNLVMNWIHPEDKGPDDWVGLFDRDVSKRVVLHRKKKEFFFREISAHEKNLLQPTRPSWQWC